MINPGIPAVPASAQEAGRTSFDQALKSAVEQLASAVNANSVAAAAASTASADSKNSIIDRIWELDTWPATPSGGTAEQPASVTFAGAEVEATAALTWGTSGGADGNITQIVFSANDTARTRTLDVTYDVNGNVTSTAWSET